MELTPEIAGRIVDAVRPCLDEFWADLIDGELTVAREYAVAVDDALQAAAITGYPVSTEVRDLLDQIDVGPLDRARIDHWLSQIPLAV